MKAASAIAPTGGIVAQTGAIPAPPPLLPRPNDPRWHYDQQRWAYDWDYLKRLCPELAEEYDAAQAAMHQSWTEGHRLRCQHGDLPNHERHQQRREIADAERRHRATELRCEQRLIAVEGRMREIIAGRAVSVLQECACGDAESFDVRPCACPSATMAEIDRVFSLDEELARA